MTSDAKTRGSHMRLERRALSICDKARKVSKGYVLKAVNILSLYDSTVHEVPDDTLDYCMQQLDKAKEWLGKARQEIKRAEINAARAESHILKQQRPES